MMDRGEIREGEVVVEAPPPTDAGLVFIGRIHTPWTSRGETPRQGSHDGPVCRLEIFEPWIQALQGLDKFAHAQVVYWLHLSRRDLV
ncbi:tRNA (N6-threonylcarbamoyladenosine(37)-N6)-methyltransferase TrmO, partial [Rhodopseudomonas palustris]